MWTQDQDIKVAFYKGSLEEKKHYWCATVQKEEEEKVRDGK